MFYEKKIFLKISQNPHENISDGVPFFIKLQAWGICFKKLLQATASEMRNTNPTSASACNFIKKESLAQAFSCEFCEISKNTFFT